MSVPEVTDGPRFKPRYTVIDQCLPDQLHQSLLDYVMSNEKLFRPATVVSDNHELLDDEVRKTSRTFELGDLQGPLHQFFAALAPDLARATGVTLSEDATILIELTASGDGGHFARHNDTSQLYRARRTRIGKATARILSAVYYFHRLPRGFSGGALRIYPWGCGDQDSGEEIDCADNRLVAFPSFADHQAMPVHCPSGRFEDSRFALNCWFSVPVGR